MNYELIRNFVTVANTLNITRSAEILFVSQSTVSHRLQLLEAALGHDLIERGRGKRLASLTDQGKAFLPIAEKWLSLWQETELFRTEAPLQHLRVGCVSSLVTCLLSDFTVAFSASHPNIRLSIQVLSTEEIYQLMNRNLLDIGIVLTHLPHQSLRAHTLLSEKMYCVCNNSDLPADSKIDPSQLDPTKEIFLNWGVEFALWHDYRFPDGAKPRLSVNEIGLIANALQKYDAWSIVPETVADLFFEKGICKKYRIKNAPPNRMSYVLTAALPASSTAELTKLYLTELEESIASVLEHSN